MESIYWVWFQALFGQGSRRSELFLSYFDHPKEIYQSLRERGKAMTMLAEKEQELWQNAMFWAEEVLRVTKRKGCRVVTPEHGEYPPLLRHIFAKPAALYVKGDLSCLQDGLNIAMVGTRTHTGYGREAAEQLARGLARHGATIVSGLARGIDTICHKAALEVNGSTVGVLGCGLDINYPSNSWDLKRAMCEKGAVISEYPMGAKPVPRHFPIRNRIIAGACQGTLVVEADLKSGSMLTAACAAEENRDVFAVPGDIFSPKIMGSHRLLRDGAFLVTGPEDILREYPWFYSGEEKGGEALPGEEQSQNGQPGAKAKLPEGCITEKKERKPVPEGLSELAAEVYRCFDGGPLQADDIAARSGNEVGGVLSALTELELYGLIEKNPGGSFGLY